MSFNGITVIGINPKDGIGSIMEYILGVFFFAKQHNLEYIHTDLEYIHHNKNNDSDWLDYWNNYIKNIFLPGVKSLSDCKYSTLKKISIRSIQSDHEDQVIYQIRPDWLKWHLDQQLNKQTDLRQLIVSNYKSKTILSDFKEGINIAVHVRRFMPTDCDRGAWREYYMPGNSASIFFINIIKNLIYLLPNAHIHIYSQGETNMFEEFLQIKGNVYLYVDNSAEHDLAHLAHADILVMSKGSFSRLANIYSDGIKLIRGEPTTKLSPNSLYILKNGELSVKQASLILETVL